MNTHSCGCSTETCGCCEGTQKLTPASVANPPALKALSYRVGTHAQFFETMKARLSTMPVEGESNPATQRTSGSMAASSSCPKGRMYTRATSYTKG